MSIAIAIDGPAGAGKSSIAKLVAKRLNFVYINTGAMYRAVTLGCIQAGFDPLDEEKTIEALPTFDIKLTSDDRVFLNGTDVTAAIREPQISILTSPVSAIYQVREHLVKLQREMAASIDVVMDGRDIGTNVLPMATVKIFMVATPEKRAHRRYLEEKEKGKQVDEAKILEDIQQRDYNDSHRKYNPLKQAPDAVLLDTSDLTIEQVVDKVLAIVAAKTGLNG